MMRRVAGILFVALSAIIAVAEGLDAYFVVPELLVGEMDRAHGALRDKNLKAKGMDAEGLLEKAIAEVNLGVLRPYVLEVKEEWSVAATRREGAKL